MLKARLGLVGKIKFLVKSISKQTELFYVPNLTLAS
jgi:hypothetical protein